MRATAGGPATSASTIPGKAHSEPESPCPNGSDFLPAAAVQDWPLHPAQEAVFFEQLAEPGAARYNIGGYIQLRGHWDPLRLQAALERFWRASEAGRLRVFLDEGRPRQRLHADAPMPALRSIDFSAGAQGREQALAWMQQRMDTAFAAESFPLVEHALLRIDEREHWYFLKQHHLVADAYSFGLQARVVLDCYRELEAGGEPAADLGLRGYGEQLLLEHGYADSPDQARDAAYWRERLRSAPAPVWPAQETRGAPALAASEQAQCEFPADLRDRLVAAAVRAGASPLHALLGLVAALVAKSTGRTDLIVGVPVHNRVYRSQKATVGMLSTVLPARVRLDPRGGFIAALESIRSLQADDLRHRRHRWPAALRELRGSQPERAILFDLMANYESFPRWQGPPGLDADVHELVGRSETMPLHAKLCDFGPQRPWLLQLDGVRQRLHGRPVDEWARDLLEVARQVLDDPERPLGEALALPAGVVAEADRRERREHFRDAACLELPLDRPRAQPGEPRRARHRFRCEPVRAEALRGWAARSGSTLETVLQASWSLLLSRLSGQERFVVAVPPDPHAEQGDEAMPALPLAARVPHRQRLAEWLREWSAALARARAIGRAACADPACAPPPAWRAFACLGQAVASDGLAQDCDLALFAHERASGLECELDYDARRLDAATVERWSGHWLTLLDAMAAADAGETPLDALALLSASEIERLLSLAEPVDWGLPAGTTVHALIEAQARRSPDAVALSDERQGLSYAEMEAKAEHLASHLRAHGVGPDVAVGVFMERAVELPVALLAILKAGGAYVPMDPDYPVSRLRSMLRDSDPKLILTQRHLLAAARLWAHDGDARAPALLAVDESPAAWPAASGTVADHRPRAAADRAGDLAYVIYTSGSTGEPKGVMNQHDGVVNRLLWAQRRFALRGGDRVLQKTPYSFDVSVWEFFLPLLAGAELVMARPAGHRDPAYLAEVMQRGRISIAHFVPSMLQVFLDQLGEARLPQLRCVLCSGEALPASLRDRFLQRLPHVQLHNLYGPTEAAVDVTHLQCAGDDGPIVSIGRPIANTRVLILDRHDRLQPPGVAGEIHLGGIQVARGYLRRPELTAARFPPLSLGAASGRYYRTGDLGRLRADGGIEYLGRNDHQIKIRGMRIELGEIRARLLALDGVRECEAATWDGPAGLHLAAFVVVEPGKPFDAEAARARLGADLPEHMVPARILSLRAMPLSANGKLDRAALVSMAANAMAHDPVGRLPITASERLLAAIVRELLGLAVVGMAQRLLDLGWHSLLATQAAHRLREVYQQPVPLPVLLGARSLEQMHAELASALGGSERVERIAETYWLLEALSADAVQALLHEGVNDPDAIAARFGGAAVT